MSELDEVYAAVIKGVNGLNDKMDQLSKSIDNATKENK